MLSTKEDRLLVFKRVLDVIEREYEADELFNQLDDERQEFKNECKSIIDMLQKI